MATTRSGAIASRSSLGRTHVAQQFDLLLRDRGDPLITRGLNQIGHANRVGASNLVTVAGSNAAVGGADRLALERPSH